MLLLTVAVVVAAMMVASAMPAFAQTPPDFVRDFWCYELAPWEISGHGTPAFFCEVDVPPGPIE